MLLMDNFIDDEGFCRQWASYESKEYVFNARYEGCLSKPYIVEFYDLHRWDGSMSHWNGHDVGNGKGMTLNEAWKDLVKNILGYENATSKEEALMKAELRMNGKLQPRGWGYKEYAAYYRCGDCYRSCDC